MTQHEYTGLDLDSKPSSTSPVAGCGEYIRKLFQIVAIYGIEPILNRTVYVDYRHHLHHIPKSANQSDILLPDCYAYLTSHHNGHNNLTLRVTIASYVARKLLNIRYKLRLARRRRSSTNPSAKAYYLACDFTMERS